MEAQEDGTLRSLPGGGGAAALPGGKQQRGLQEGEDSCGDEDKDRRGLEEDKKKDRRGLEEDKKMPQQAVDGAPAADASTIIPWGHRHFNAYKPAPPRPIRIITAPRSAAPGQEMWTRTATNREEVNYAVELQNLSKSMATIGSGLGKVCNGFGLKIISPKEKEAAAAMEKKAIEEKKAAEELIAAEEKLAIAKLSASEMEERKKEEEEEKRRAEEEAKKEKRIALLLSVPGNLVNTSSVLNGLGEIASGSRGVAISMCLMVSGVPSLVRQVQATSANWIGQGSSKCSIMGTGSLGLRMALDTQVVTRASDGRISVVDAFGSKIERVPRALGGALIITSQEELNQAIADFKNGRLRQLIDVDEKLISLMMARNIWRHLCRENLCGLLRPDSALPEMALQASVLINEVHALKGDLQDAEDALEDAKKAVRAHQLSINEIQGQLHRPRM